MKYGLPVSGAASIEVYSTNMNGESEASPSYT